MPTPSYRERKGRESLILLRVEAVQLHGVPWVLLIYPCFGVAYSIRSTRDDFVDEVWAFPWRFQLRHACLLETKYKVARLERPSAYPFVVVVAEAFMVDC
jgi:hypothetical protein